MRVLCNVIGFPMMLSSGVVMAAMLAGALGFNWIFVAIPLCVVGVGLFRLGDKA